MRKVCKWHYKTKGGNVVGHVIRLEDENKLEGSKSRKDIIPYFKEGGQSGIPKDMPPEYRIYGMDSVKDLSSTFYIVEGEKCAAALHGLGYQAITNLGGAGQGKLADWSVIDGATDIVLLPDNDPVGFRYMQGVYGQVKQFKNPPRVTLAQMSSIEKGDVCDFLKALPELQGWDEYSSLENSAAKLSIQESFDSYVSEKIDEIPAAWKFIVTPNKHKLIALNDFKNLKLAKRHMILAPWMPEGSINMIFADRGIGKTFFSLSCALAIANGNEFLSYSAEVPASVLYLDGEMQATAIQERLYLLSGGKETKAPLTLYTPDCQENDYTPDLGTEEGRSQINELIEAVNPKVIFIDNISTFDRSGNENEAESWAPIQAWAIQHRKKGRSIIFVHHANKEGKQRGSHKKEDVMDAVIRLKRPEDFVQGEGGTKIVVQYTKARHLSGEAAQDLEATLCDDGALLKWEWQQGDVVYRQAVEMMKDGISLRDIAEELGIGKSTVGRWKNRAQSEDLLK
jgi:RecA-family ATPase